MNCQACYTLRKTLLLMPVARNLEDMETSEKTGGINSNSE